MSTKTKIKPLGNRVLVKRSEAKQSKGSILLPESAQEKPKQGTVVAVGPGKHDEQGKLQPLSVKVGEEVLFGSYAGTAVPSSVLAEEKEVEYLILSEEEIFGSLSSQ